MHLRSTRSGASRIAGMMNARAAARLGVIFAGLAAAMPASAQWGQFRGPNGAGVDTATGYPVTFSPTSGVVWKAAVPFAQSSPVVAGGRVYVTAGDGDRLVTIAFDAGSGREAWRRSLARSRQGLGRRYRIALRSCVEPARWAGDQHDRLPGAAPGHRSRRTVGVGDVAGERRDRSQRLRGSGRARGRGAGGSAGFGQLRARGRSQVGYVDPVCLRGRPT